MPDGEAMPAPSAQAERQPITLQSRAHLRSLLLDAGLARGAAEKVSRAGWAALAGEPTESDLAEDCAALARTLAATFKDFSK
jgi:hypothetical protein